MTRQITSQSLIRPIPEKIIAAFSQKYALKTGHVEALASELAKFLSICATYPNNLTPSPKIDAIWHEFIIHTKDYHEYCMSTFGRFIHHNPSILANAGTYNNSRDLILDNYGEINNEVWPKPSDIEIPLCFND